MTNPFHDELGRFCSQSGMQQAIARVAENGNINDALNLKANYERFTTVGDTTPDTERVANILRITRSISPESALAGSVSLQKYSQADLKAAEKNLKAETKTLQDERAEIDAKLDDLQKNYEEDSGTDIPLHSASYKVMNLEDEAKTEIKPVLRELRAEAVAAGIPRFYAETYIAKLQANTGIENYTNPYSRTGDIVNKPLKELSAENFPINTRPKTHGEKFRELAEKYQEAGKFNSFNEKVGIAKPASASYGKFQQQYRDQSIARGQNQKAQEENNKKLAVIETHKQWRDKIKEEGISKYASVLEAGEVNQNNIRTDKTGKITNVWGVRETTDADGTTTRTITPIRDVAPAWQVRENEIAAHSFVDENGGKYVSVTHYANFKTSSSRSYVIVDPTVKGEKQFKETHPDVNQFGYSYDSGD